MLTWHTAGVAGRVGRIGGRSAQDGRPAHVVAVLPQDSLRHHQQERQWRHQQNRAQETVHTAPYCSV